ncbi:MAG TPA: GDSL-type esterase/lipase family protein [Candidatus Andersenbacteria bacterium]|nr:GDSL-type esterase/lipase family protein [Candidatus Andersenbacteria bacterium]
MIKDSAKTILCYGDSNTWGSVPRSSERYPYSIRWTSILQYMLGDEYEVIVNGVCGRTLVASNPEKPWLCGITHLQAILESAKPVSLIIIMLGTNDVKSTYSLSAEDIQKHLEQTVLLIQENQINLEAIPKVLVVCPAPVITPAINDLDEQMVRGLDIFPQLPKAYKETADRYGCEFLNAGDSIQSSSIDGYHLNAEAHEKLAEIISTAIKKLPLT